MNKLDTEVFRTFYEAYRVKKDYERRMLEYDNLPLSRRIFTPRPKDPCPDVKDSYSLEKKCGEALKKCFPLLDSVLAGSDSLEQFNSHLVFGFKTMEGIPDVPTVNFQITDAVHNTFSDLPLFYEDGYLRVPYQHYDDPEANLRNRQYAQGQYYTLQYKDPALKTVYNQLNNMRDLIVSVENDSRRSVVKTVSARSLKNADEAMKSFSLDSGEKVVLPSSFLNGMDNLMTYGEAVKWLEVKRKACVADQRPATRYEGACKDFEEAVSRYVFSGKILSDLSRQYGRESSLDDIMSRSHWLAAYSDVRSGREHSFGSYDCRNFISEAILSGYSSKQVTDYFKASGFSEKDTEFVSNMYHDEMAMLVGVGAYQSSSSYLAERLVEFREVFARKMNETDSQMKMSLDYFVKCDRERLPEAVRYYLMYGQSAEMLNEYLEKAGVDSGRKYEIGCLIKEREEKKGTMERPVEYRQTVVGVKDSDKDYDMAMARIKDELDRYARAGENPDKAVVAGITGYYCGMKGVNADSMSRALKDAGITGTDDNLFALDEYRSGMTVKESLEKDEEKEIGVRDSKTVGIKMS